MENLFGRQRPFVFRTRQVAPYAPFDGYRCSTVNAPHNFCPRFSLTHPLHPRSPALTPPPPSIRFIHPQGDWRGISRHFVQSRTPTQVASHAQKYFIRQNNLNKRKRRSSLFDIVSEAPAEPAKAPEVASKPPAGIPGGLSMAFAAGMPAFTGFNPSSMPMPPGFGAHGAVPAAKKAGAGMDEGEKAAAATIAALAGSPIAAAGFAQAAAAAGSKGSNPWEVKHAPLGASPPGQHNAQQAAAAAAANPFAAMMAMGAMGQMGAQMPPPAAWMQGYHQFMQQMAAAGAAHQQAQAQAARPPMPPPPAGVTFPPNFQGFTPGVFPAAHNVFGNFMNGAMAKPAGEKPETVAKKEGSATAVTV